MIPEIIARQACTHSPWKFQNWRIEIEEFSWMFFLFSIWGLILGKFRAKESYVVSFQVRIFQWPLPQISSDNQVCHESNVLTGNHKSVLYKLIIYYLPWVPEVFSCVWRGASSATGRGHAQVTFEDLNETGNRAWKASGTQGIYCYTSSDNILLSIWILVTLFSSCVIVLYSLFHGLFYMRFYKTLSGIFYSH